MKSLPDISVIVCCYNQDKWLERCIRSINHQQHIKQYEYEILIVNDGSSDNTDDVLKNLCAVDNVRVIKNEDNLGLPASLNIAIQKSIGRYVVRVDSDDYISRDLLHIMKLFLDKNKKYQAIATDYVVVDCFENTIKNNVDCFANQIACGVMFRKECLFDIGLYNPSFKMREGHEMRKRFEEKFKIGRIELPLYKYRDHEHNRTKDLNEVNKYNGMLKNT